MFWDDLLAYGPEILWKLNDAAGAVAVDSSGNGRNGTYVNAPTLAQASLIPNCPGDASVRVTAASLQMVQRAHEAWMNGDVFTFGMFYKPATIPAEHDLFGKQERVQVWVEANGALTYYEFDSDWQPLTSAAAVVAAGGTYMIVITCSATERRLFVNGVRKILSTGANPRDSTGNPMQFGHSSTSTTRYANGNMQGCFWIASSLSDAQITALYASSQAAPTPPSAPTAFTHPLVGEEYVDANVPADWGDSAPNSADTYELQYSDDGGGSWHALATPAVSAYSWDPSARPSGSNYKLRVRGVNAYGNSAWVESGVFIITHLDPGINFRTSGTIDDIVHNAPGLPPRDEGEDPTTAWLDDLVPDPAKWTPVGPMTTRWREGYGFSTPSTLRENVARLHAYGGDIGGTYPAADPVLADNHAMILQHVHTADNLYGLFVTKVAWVCLWRDPVTGSALFYQLGNPASLRFFDGPGNAMAGDIAGTRYLADGSTAAGHQPLSGSWGSSYDEDVIEVGFSVVDGFVTLYYTKRGSLSINGVVQVQKFTVDLSLYISTPGGVAYALTNNQQVPEWRALRLTTSDYIEIGGLQPGWIVKAQSRTYENWVAYNGTFVGENPVLVSREAVTFNTMQAVADGSGVARIFPDSPSTLLRIDDSSPDWAGLGAIDYTITAPDSWTFDSLAVFIDEETEVDRYTDLKNVRIGDTFLWSDMPMPAYRPAAFVSPVADQIVGAVLPQAVTITAHVPAHPEAETVKYQWEYSADGVTWALAQDWQAAVTFNWDHHLLPFTRNAQFRVRARGDVSLIPSGWLYSGVFVLYHSTGALTIDDTSALEVVGNVTQFSVFVQPLESPDGHKGTRWKIYDEDAVVVDVIFYGDGRNGAWITGLSGAHVYDAQYALIDYLDVEGEFSAKRDFVTLNLAAHSPHTAVDLIGNAEGSYRNVDAPFIDAATGGVPEILVGGGARLNSYGRDFEQTPAVFPYKSHHMIRMTSTEDAYPNTSEPSYVGGHREAFTILLVLTPQDLSEAREIMGKAGSLFVWHTAAGVVKVTINTTIRHDFHVIAYGDGEFPYSSGNTDFTSGQSLQVGVMQAIFLGGQNAWYGTQLALLEPAGTPIEIRVPASPETEVKITELYLSADGSWTPRLVLGALADRFDFGTSRVSQWDIGHGSTNADASSDVEASGHFAEMIAHRFFMWHALLDAATIKALQSFVDAEDLVALDAYVDDMEEQPFTRPPFREYPRPHKPAVTSA